jgi:membrane protease YdiL (CAAX protease family)
MDNESLSTPPEFPPSSVPPSDGLLNKIFLNAHGLRAGWRLLIYVVLVAGLGFGIGIVLRLFFAGQARGVFSPLSLFIQESVSFAVVFGAALIMARIEKRSPGVYGLPAAGLFGRLFWQGWFVGLCEVTALIGLIAAFGGYSFGSLAVHGEEIARWAAVWGLFFVLVGFFEEFAFRGYTQFTLGDGIGFWPAGVLLSTAFGAVHLTNPGEGPVGAASVVMIGLVFVFALKRTGNLWFVVGLHASFDFGETFLYSVPNSGIVFPGHLSDATLHGANWLTGGTIGPEGSVFSFLTMGILVVLIHFLYPAKEKQPFQAETQARIQ